jgi:hypothetical protein
VDPLRPLPDRQNELYEKNRFGIRFGVGASHGPTPKNDGPQIVYVQRYDTTDEQALRTRCHYSSYVAGASGRDPHDYAMTRVGILQAILIWIVSGGHHSLASIAENHSIIRYYGGDGWALLLP